jgi:integrase
MERFRQEMAFSDEITVVRPRIRYIERYFDFCQSSGLEPFSRESVFEYRNHILKDGYAASTARNMLNCVRRAFVIAGIPFPLGKRWLPTVINLVRPTLTVEEVERLIKAAKQGLLSREQSFFLAMSSVYGLRREELRRLEKSDFDFHDKRVRIKTAKGGMQRLHVLPDPILPYLQEHKFEQFTPFQLSVMWWDILRRAGIEGKPGSGWHSIRRSLDTKLIEVLPLPTVKSFLRWKLTSSSEMALAYYSEDPESVDRKVFSVHPYLPFWSASDG